MEKFGLRVISVVFILASLIIISTGMSIAFGDNSLDNFTSSTLSTDWNITDVVGNVTNSLTNNPGHLQIIIPANKTYNCRDNINTCFNIMKQMQNGDTTYETKIDSTTINQRYQSYGIILYQDNQNYLTYELWAQGNVIRPVIWKISGGLTTAIINSPITLATSNYLRLTKSGTTISTQYSSDGNNWNTTTTFTASTSVNNAGITINSYGNNQGITTNIDYFKIGNPAINNTNQTTNNTNQTNTTTQNYTLTITKSGNGTGTITSNTGGISCGATCTAKYTSETNVILTATPNTNNTFTTWTGACSGAGTCTINMSQNRTANAQFTINQTNNQTNQTSNQSNQTTPSGLIAAYNFNEGTGTTLNDISGNGNTGTINGATWTTGKYGSALSFNGASSYVDLGNPSDLQLTGSMTIEAWINAAANPPDDGDIISKDNAITGWQLKTSPDITPHTFGLAISPSSGGSHTQRYSTSTRSLNTWYHVAGVYNSTTQTMNIYVNGVLNNGALNGAVPSSRAVSGSNVLIGKNSAGYLFNGIIDDIRIYDRVLSQAEIQQDMNTPISNINCSNDFTAPSTSVINSPSSPTITDSVTITSTSSDLCGISQTQIFVDNTLVKTCTSETTCSVNPQLYALGAHTYNATVVDNSPNHNIGTDPASGSKTFTVLPDNVPPTVSITNSPSIPKSTQQVTFTATANDASGINNIKIYVDGALANTCNGATTCTYSGGPYANNTNHTYNATAIDNSPARNAATANGNFRVNDIPSAKFWVTTFYASWSMQPLGNYYYTALPNEINWSGITNVIHFSNANVVQQSPYYEPAIPGSAEAIAMQCAYPGGCPAGRNYQQELIDAVHAAGATIELPIMAVDPTNFNYVIANPNRTATFIDAVVTYGEQKGYDGVDINVEDWITSGPNAAQMSAFLYALRARMASSPSFKLITLSPGDADAYSGTNARYEAATINAVVDQLNPQMGTVAWLWDGDHACNAAWFLNPLYLGNTPAPFNDYAGYWTADGPLQWQARGFNISKVGMGTPSNVIIYHGANQIFQCYSWASSNCRMRAAYDLLNDGGTEYWDDARKVNYITGTAVRASDTDGCGVSAGEKFYATYDSPQAYQAEIAWGIQNHIGGIMLYDVGFDLDNTKPINLRLPNHNAVVQAVRAYQGN